MNKFRFGYVNFGQPLGHCLNVPWISAAMNRHVQEIDVSIHLNAPQALPRELFSCKTLTILSLDGRFNIVLPRSACLPCLKTCFLQSVCFDDDSARRFFQSCPALERLNLTGCNVREGVGVLDISVPTLKHLTLDAYEDSYQLVFNLPNLLYFEYMGPTENEFLGLETWKSVVDVCIDYEPSSYTTNGVVVKLICAICHVQKLQLSCTGMEAFVYSGHSLPTFNNLTRLTFGPISSLASRTLSDLLDNTPRLEFLSFYQGSDNEDDGAVQDSYLLPEHVPVCVSRHVKEIELICCFSKWEYYFKLVEYLLKNAMILDKMKIQSCFSCEEQLEITKKVFAFPRSSTACEVVIELVDLKEE